MFKLTQEQQARTHVEDRLEDALVSVITPHNVPFLPLILQHRLWRQNGSTGKAKGFFASFFSAANSMVNPHHNQQNRGSGNTPEKGGGTGPGGQTER